ncbi:GGDEF domain-containing protein [Caryophanon latum]|nr:GGDEF domain-containing protein [Caryophanon latum]
MHFHYFIIVSIVSFSVVMQSLMGMNSDYVEKVNDGIFLVNTLLIGIAIQYFISSAQRRIIEQDMQLKESVAKAENLTSELLKANELLMKRASYDHLTMIPNRTGFYTYATEYIKERCQPLTLLMMDVDYFKQYNDFYNHVQGDHVLYELAQIIERVVATYDGYAARWGGEEFLIMTTPMHAENICCDIQQEVAKAAIVHERSQVNPYVTVSIGGYSGFITSVEQLDDFYKRADVMLYEVKQHGRNHYRIEKAVTVNA